MGHPAFVWVITRSGYIQSRNQVKVRYNFISFSNVFTSKAWINQGFCHVCPIQTDTSITELVTQLLY